ncbi:MAG: hypothetical protein HW401_837 [Parcubacteria group bacterium]|nr:hypothetical protein [Parcubacteria group bacterium]
MITLEKFFRALEKVKSGGYWSIGLIIANGKDVVFDILDKEFETVKMNGTTLPATIIKKIEKVFSNGKWVVLDINNKMPVEIYNQLKLLSSQNRILLETGEEIRQPDSARVIVKASQKTVKIIEADFSDFKYLFGPIINI